jgi:hypothetical protein
MNPSMPTAKKYIFTLRTQLPKCMIKIAKATHWGKKTDLVWLNFTTAFSLLLLPKSFVFLKYPSLLLSPSFSILSHAPALSLNFTRNVSPAKANNYGSHKYPQASKSWAEDHRKQAQCKGRGAGFPSLPPSRPIILYFFGALLFAFPLYYLSFFLHISMV